MTAALETWSVIVGYISPNLIRIKNQSPLCGKKKIPTAIMFVLVIFDK